MEMLAEKIDCVSYVVSQIKQTMYIECEYHVFMVCDSYEDLQTIHLSDTRNRSLQRFINLMKSENEKTNYNNSKLYP